MRKIHAESKNILGNWSKLWSQTDFTAKLFLCPTRAHNIINTTELRSSVYNLFSHVYLALCLSRPHARQETGFRKFFCSRAKDNWKWEEKKWLIEIKLTTRAPAKCWIAKMSWCFDCRATKIYSILKSHFNCFLIGNPFVCFVSVKICAKSLQAA